MKLTTSKTAVFFAALLMVAGFQNCSKVKFDAENDVLGEKLLTENGLDDTAFPDNDDIDPIINNPQAEKEASDFCAQFRAGKSSGEQFSSQITSQSVVDIHKHRGSLLIDNAKMIRLGNIRGVVFAKTEDGSRLNNMRGNLCLISTKQGGGDLDQLNNHRGHIEIVNMNTGVINNTRGKLVIRGGTVDEIKNHRGTIELLDNAKVQRISNQRGQIIAADGAVGELSNVKGK